MAIKQESVSLPMASAGIIGFSPNIKISGFEIDPKILIIATTIFVMVVKIANILRH